MSYYGSHSTSTGPGDAGDGGVGQRHSHIDLRFLCPSSGFVGEGAPSFRGLLAFTGIIVGTLYGERTYPSNLWDLLIF